MNAPKYTLASAENVRWLSPNPAEIALGNCKMIVRLQSVLEQRRQHLFTKHPKGE